MTYDFNFKVAHDYSDAIAIRVPVTLRSGKDETNFNAYVDTGSAFAFSGADKPRRWALTLNREALFASIL